MLVQISDKLDFSVGGATHWKITSWELFKERCHKNCRDCRISNLLPQYYGKV